MIQQNVLNCPYCNDPRSGGTTFCASCGFNLVDNNPARSMKRNVKLRDVPIVVVFTSYILRSEKIGVELEYEN